MVLFGLTASLFWAFCAVFYCFFLKNDTFFQLRRLWLWLSMAGDIWWASQTMTPDAHALPLVQLEPVFKMDEALSSDSKPDWYQIACMVYAIGVLLAGFRLLRGLWKLYRMIKKGRWTRLDEHIVLVEVQNLEHPVSFFRFILTPPDFSPERDAAIFAHERAHIIGKHSWEVLLLEVMLVVLWLHPFIYWFRGEIRILHEYLADRAVLQTHSRGQYGRLLLKQSGHFPLALQFYQSPLHLRLNMLGQAETASVNRWKYVVILPLIAIFTGLGSEFRAPLPLVTTQLDQLPQFPGGTQALFQYLNTAIKYPELAQKQGIEGMVVVRFVVLSNGRLTQIGTRGADNSTLQAEAIRVVKKMPEWIPGTLSGRAVAAEVMLPIKFKLQ